ncbi:MAG: hypothetical protein ACTSVV_07335 [Promethearchaeota archaeon]
MSSLKFCNECGTLMFPHLLDGKKVLSCRCGAIRIIKDNLDAYKLNQKIVHTEREEIVSTSSIQNWKAKYLRNKAPYYRCKRCNSYNIEIYAKQTRRAHKGMTQFLVCLNCNSIVRFES